MKKILVILVLLLASCSASNKLDIQIRNNTDQPINLSARTGLFGNKIKLDPGETWNGWIYRNMPIDQVRIDVSSIDEVKK